MFAQKSINQQINNDIFINSTLMQIEKGIDLYINKFDINKDTSMKIQHDLMGLSINISFSAHHHYVSAKCAFKIIPKAGYTVTSYINHDSGIVNFKTGDQIQNIIINISDEVLVKHLPYDIYKRLRENEFSMTLASRLSSRISTLAAREIFVNTATNTITNSFASELFIKARVYDIVVFDLKALAQANSNELVNLSKEDINAINQALIILQKNYHNPPTIKEISHAICLNESKLKSGFKQLFGMTVHECSTKIRMQEAKRLISAGELNLAQIAKELGYKQQHNFTTAFKKHFGFNPSSASALIL